MPTESRENLQPDDAATAAATEHGPVSRSEPILNSFFEYTTAHGFYKLRAENKGLRRLWVLIIFSAMVAFGVHIILLAINYMQYIVTVETKYNSEPFVLPDVTFCPNQPYHESVWCRRDILPECSVDANVTIPSLGGGISVQSAFLNAVSFWQAAGEGLSAREVARYSMRRYTAEANMTRNPVTTVVYCNFMGDACGPWNMTTFYDPLSEACVTVSLTDRRVFQAGEQSALDLVLFSYISQQRDFPVPYFSVMTSMEQFDFNFGYSMYIHPPNTTPDHSQDVQVSESRSYVINTAIERSKSIDLPAKRCSDSPGPLRLLQFDRLRIFAYTKSACESVAAQQVIVQRCGCLSEKNLIPESLASVRPYCHDLDPSLVLYPYVTLQNRTLQNVRNLTLAAVNATQCWNATANATVACNYTKWSQWNATYVDPLSVARTAGLLARRQCHKEAEAYLEANAGYKDACPRPCESVNYPFTSLSTKLISISDNYVQDKLDEIKLAVNASVGWAINNSVYYGDLENVGRDLFVLSAIGTHYLYTRVQLIPNRKEGVTTVEKLSYPPEQFWSDVGGVLGLWAGLSIISCTEFLQLFFLAASTLRAARHRVNGSSKSAGGSGGSSDGRSGTASDTSSATTANESAVDRSEQAKRRGGDSAMSEAFSYG